MFYIILIESDINNKICFKLTDEMFMTEIEAYDAVQNSYLKYKSEMQCVTKFHIVELSGKVVQTFN